MKAVFSRPDRPNPRPRVLESSASPKAHHVRDANELAPAVAFLHLPVDQLRCHLPLTPSQTHLKPLAKMGREARRSTSLSHRS